VRLAPALRTQQDDWRRERDVAGESGVGGVMRSRALLVTVCIIAIVAARGPLHAETGAHGLTGAVTTHVVVKGDTLGGLAARFGVEAATLAAENGLKTNATLTAGQMLRVDNRHLIPAAAGERRIVINVPQRMLFYGFEGVVAGMPVAVGQASWRTPLQRFTVLTKETDPTWEVPESIRAEARQQGRTLPAAVPPGPSNPLGRFWLGLSIPGVGIHSTNAPSSIYRVTTHGCIRVGPHDMEWLFPRVDVGTPGDVIYEPILLALVGEEIYLEAHRDVYRRVAESPMTIVRSAARAAGLEHQIDWATVAAVLSARHGVARVVGRTAISR
jgi:L,D-transpeptidase ErfK/SrfK